MKAKVSSPPGRRGAVARSNVPTATPTNPPRSVAPDGPIEPGQQWIWKVDPAVLLIVKSWSSDGSWDVVLAGQPVKRTTAQILEGYELPALVDEGVIEPGADAGSAPPRLVPAQ